MLAIMSVATLATAQQMAITGTVTDAVTGDPIFHARVHAMHAGMTYTDSAGDYTLNPMRPGAYVVAAMAEGYEPAVYPDTVYIEQGQTIEDIDFALDPMGPPPETGAISGTVTDSATGDPIEGAWVHTFQRRHAVTNEDGEYLLDSLPAGDYIVHASAMGYQGAVYPDTVTVVGGQTTEDIDFALVPYQPREFGAIAGTVTDSATGDPIEGAWVHTYHRRHAVTNEDGEYLLDSLPAGDYIVMAGAEGYEGARYPDTVTVTAGQTTEDIDFALVPCQPREFGAIAGTVTDSATGDPIEGAWVHTFHRRYAVTNEDGEYLLDSLPAGDYIVRAMAMGYQGAVYPDTLTVVGGQTIEDIDFDLVPCQPRYGVISGEVTDDETGELIRGAVVKARNGQLVRQVIQGYRGYHIGMLPPGKYWITAVAPGYEPGTYGDSVEVAAGQHVDSIDFTLERGGGGRHGGVAGQVTNAATGDPIVGAYVVARGPSRGYSNTNPRGFYLIRDLAPGEYVVRAYMRGFEPSAPETVDVVAGQITDSVDFELEPMGGREMGFIAGTVTDSATGDPIFHAYVFVRGMRGQGMAYTDSSGNYLLRVRPGSYVVRASARRHFPAVYPDSVTVANGDTVYDIDFVLRGCPRLGAGIAGFVFDGYSQEDLAGVTVTAIGEENSYEIETDEWGEYVFEGIEPGDYRIEVSITGYGNEMYPDLVIVDPDEVESFTTPWMYPLSGVEESPEPGRVARTEMAVGPNPFSRTTTVRWQVPVSGHVSLRVTDVSGRVVVTLQDGHMGAGSYSAVWDGTDSQSRRVVNGVYFYHLDAAGARAIEKVVLVAR
jgi:protocatechuate 3,4-dioxygenase beta subunit